MLLLFETPAGYSLFKVRDEDKLKDIDALAKSFSSAESAKKVVSMKAFGKFENTTDALAAAATMVESKVGKSLKTFLKKHVKDETLAIADSKLGVAIKEKLDRVRVFEQRDGVDARGEISIE